jgi:hypothetical protein
VFNRSQFNRMPFNRPYSVEVLFSATLDGSGVTTAALNLEFNMTTTLDGTGSLIVDMIRELFFVAQLDGIGTLTVEMIRERFLAAQLNGEGTISAVLKRYHVDEIEVTGPFAPGDKIIIDSKKLRVTKNGQTVGYEGDFFDLNTGNNQIIYTDAAAGRTVQFRVTHRDKYI